MDVHDKLDELAALIEGARSMPMSASCVVHRGEVLALVDDLRELLPEELRHAEALLDQRESVIEEGRREAGGILDAAHQEHARLVAETEVLADAHREADEVRRTAEDDAASKRHETDEYVDAKLAGFEAVLNKTLAAVHRGRQKLGVGTGLADPAEGMPYDGTGEDLEPYDDDRASFRR